MDSWNYLKVAMLSFRPTEPTYEAAPSPLRTQHKAHHEVRAARTPSP